MSSAMVLLEELFYSVLTSDVKAALLEPVCARLAPVLRNPSDAEAMGYGLDMAACLVGDFAAATPVPVCTAFLQTALSVLGDAGVDRGLKPKALDLLFELSHGPRDTFVAALPAILPLVSGACSMECTVSCSPGG
jgi:hypothetical protein